MSVALLTAALGGIAVPEADCLTEDMHRGLTFSRELSGHAKELEDHFLKCVCVYMIHVCVHSCLKSRAENALGFSPRLLPR